MSRLFDIVRHAPRAALLIALIASTVLLVAHVEAGATVSSEAPAQKKTGAGFVILVSLQRSR